MFVTIRTCKRYDRNLFKKAHEAYIRRDLETLGNIESVRKESVGLIQQLLFLFRWANKEEELR